MGKEEAVYGGDEGAGECKSSWQKRNETRLTLLSCLRLPPRFP